jgi:hypothetical protein
MSKDMPAFPCPESSVSQFGDPTAYEGMTLRDYFAAKAMQAEYSTLQRLNQFEEMLKERNEK